jgi:hypothetical protein
MKKPLLLASLLTTGTACFAQQVLISQNFDSFAAGNLLAQTAGAPWVTWSGGGGGAEDTPISSAQAYSGALSASFTSTSANGGPSDIVLQLGNRTTGRYALGWYMYVASGKGGYFNIQKSMTPGQSWGLDVTFRASGGIELSPNAQVGAITSYTADEWFLVGMVIDLNTSSGVLTINGEVAGTWLTTTASGAAGTGLNQIGAINFYAYAGGDQTEYYIDDVTFVDLTGVGVPEHAELSATAFPNPTEGRFTIDLQGLSASATVSVADLTGRQVMPALPLVRRGAAARAEVDLTSQPSGLYFVRVQDGERDLVRRVTKH